MRRPARGNASRNAVSLTTQIPAPTKGWTTETPANAKEGTALVMNNWFPEVDYVRPRKGFESYATGMTGNVESLMVYTSGTAEKIFAANDGKIYDVSAAGAVGAAAVSSLNNDRWQHTMFATSGGQFLIICNGEDSVRSYSGAAWATPSITGATSSTFINVCAHKKRLWFVEVNTTKLWYLGTEAIAGAATAFDVGAFFTEGGYVMACGTWTLDAGDGIDDFFVIASSRGEILLYRGTDPSSSTTWEMVGRYKIGHPLGRRCFFQVGGDLAIITDDGVVPLSKAIQVDRAVIQNVSITREIQRAYSDAVRASEDDFGWQLISYPMQNMAVLNVPGGASSDTQQFVFNTISGAWGRFVGMDALCWALFDEQIYYGGSDGKIYKAETGATDNGQNILCELLPSYMHLSAKGRLKMVHAVRPIWFTDVPGLTPQIAIGTDYETPTDTGGSQETSDGFFIWDSSAWDGADVWYGYNIQQAWRGTGNIGTVISPYTFMSIDAPGVGADWQFNLTAWDMIYEVGGVI